MFVVYGEANRLHAMELKEMLEKRWSLNVVLLEEEPPEGMTLVEKLEKYGRQADHAFVIMSPDDCVRNKGEQAYYQPRPNVLFEAGWFCHSLRRKGVTFLVQEGTDLHSDISGINYIPFRKRTREVFLEIEGELRKAGVIPG